MNAESPLPGFFPDDPTDGRQKGDWRTRYSDTQAMRAIRSEAIYVAVLLFLVPVSILLIWFEVPRTLIGIDLARYKALEKYAYAWLGGTLGGTLFDIKWLIHSIAKHFWNLDRRLWRLFTPHASGALAFVTVLLISSGILRIFDQAALGSPTAAVAIGFMVGYFSDSAMAKLAEVAEALFGTIRKPRERQNYDDVGGARPPSDP